jgi:hypothetical protein
MVKSYKQAKSTYEFIIIPSQIILKLLFLKQFNNIH